MRALRESRLFIAGLPGNAAVGAGIATSGSHAIPRRRHSLFFLAAACHPGVLEILATECKSGFSFFHWGRAPDARCVRVPAATQPNRRVLRPAHFAPAGTGYGSAVRGSFKGGLPSRRLGYRVAGDFLPQGALKAYLLTFQYVFNILSIFKAISGLFMNYNES
jgi:hypothetical protein